jgi:hypothetical protein
MPALTATPDNNQGRIILNATGLVATGHVYTIVRQMPDGRVENVRNAEPIPAGLTAYVVNDWEVPPDTAVRYGIDDRVGSSHSLTYYTELTLWVLGPFPYNCRLLHPTIPALSVKSIISELSELTRNVRTETHYPLGRPDPVVVAQVRQYPTGAVQLLTMSDVDRKALVSLLTQAAVFCLQTDSKHTLNEGSMWFAAGELVERRTDTPSALTKARIWELKFAQVSRPPGLVTSAVSAWSGVPAAYATWAVTVANNADWNALVFGQEVTPS